MSPTGKREPISSEYLTINGQVRARIHVGVNGDVPPRKPRIGGSTGYSPFKNLWDAFERDLPVTTTMDGDGLPADKRQIMQVEYDLPMLAKRAWDSLYGRERKSKDHDIDGYVSEDGKTIVVWKLPEGTVARQKK